MQVTIKRQILYRNMTKDVIPELKIGMMRLAQQHKWNDQMIRKKWNM